MKSNREDIYAALFTLGAKAPGLVTMSRRAQTWSSVPVDQQPAFFQQQIKEIAQSPAVGRPHIWELHVDWIFYVNAGSDPNAIMSSQLNPILDFVDRNLPVGILPGGPAKGIQNLGGLVVEAKIVGEIKTDEGVLGGQGVAIVPIRILAI